MSKFYSDKAVLSSWAKEALDSIEAQAAAPKPKQFLYHLPDWMSGMVSDEQLQVMAQQKQGELQPLVDMLEGCSIRSIVNAAYEMFGEDVEGFVRLCASHQAGMDEGDMPNLKSPSDPTASSLEESETAATENIYPEQGVLDNLTDDDGKPDTPALPQNGS
jgi:hypothetical protein